MMKMREYEKIPNVFERETFGKNRLIEGLWSTPELEYLNDLTWLWTEKVDGTNIRVCWDGHRVSWLGRTDRAEIPVPLHECLQTLFGGEDKEELFEQVFGEKEAILFGEGYGGKIQKNGGLYGETNFILFDVLVGDMYLKQTDMRDVANKLGINAVPLIGVGSLEDAIGFIRTHPKSELRDFEMEGVVCRPAVELRDRQGKRIIVKVKCRDFQKEETDD